ncbi:hypothetical protein ACFE04_031910 [Oxalis oulophora]
MSIVASTATSSTLTALQFHVRCSNNQPNRGFGPKKRNEGAKDKGLASQQRNSTKSIPNRKRFYGLLYLCFVAAYCEFSRVTQAPGLNSQYDGKSRSASLDFDFEERLQSVRRSALEQKKADEKKEFGAIDYDAPVESGKKTIGLGTKPL